MTSPTRGPRVDASPGGESRPVEVRVALQVNGSESQVDILPGHTLLNVLRDRLRLLSVREGCGIGICGACTVLMDGRPVSSCLQLAVLAQGRQITTVEGLAENGQLHPVQQAFVDHTAFQCSYCTPGFVLATVGLLTDIEDPSTVEIEEYLAGNLCRCGSYVKILDAVLQAKHTWHPPRDRSFASASPRTVKGPERPL